LKSKLRGKRDPDLEKKKKSPLLPAIRKALWGAGADPAGVRRIVGPGDPGPGDQPQRGDPPPYPRGSQRGKTNGPLWLSCCRFHRALGQGPERKKPLGIGDKGGVSPQLKTAPPAQGGVSLRIIMGRVGMHFLFAKGFLGKREIGRGGGGGDETRLPRLQRGRGARPPVSLVGGHRSSWNSRGTVWGEKLGAGKGEGIHNFKQPFTKFGQGRVLHLTGERNKRNKN